MFTYKAKHSSDQCHDYEASLFVGKHPQSTAAEQLRLVQANNALRSDTSAAIVGKADSSCLVSNGTSSDYSSSSKDVFVKKENNNGEVHFNLENLDTRYSPCIDRETVL